MARSRTPARPARFTLIFRSSSAEFAGTACSVAEALAQEFSVEIVTASAFAEWDHDVVAASVEKTSKVLVMHDNSGNELLAAELAATIAEDCFHDLDAPVRRVAVPDPALTTRVRDLAEF